MRIQHYLEYAIFRAATLFIQAFPLATIRRIGAALGGFVYRFVRYRKSITEDNLRNAFPEMSESEIRKLAEESFRSLGTAFFEILWLPRLTAETMKPLACITNTERAYELLSRGKGLIIVTAHAANWEWAAQAYPVWICKPITSIVKTQSNRMVDAYINWLRTRWGMSVISMDASVREMLRVLQRGEALGIVADQTAGAGNVRVPFFGRETPVHLGPAIFSLRTGAPIVMAIPLRKPDGNYEMTFEEVKQDDLTEYSEENVVELARRFTSMMEQAIMRAPGQWMWTHRRWKHVQPRVKREEANE